MAAAHQDLHSVYAHKQKNHPPTTTHPPLAPVLAPVFMLVGGGERGARTARKQVGNTVYCEG